MSVMMNQAISAYRKATTTVPPVKAVVLLYDEAINAAQRAAEATDEKLYDEAQTQMLRAVTILRGLRQALDMDAGGSVAKQLMGVYSSVILALTQTAGKPDAVERYHRLAEGLTELRDAWATMTTLPARGMPAEAAE
ncbi:flagellar protein FliS [Breoghania corrubedonensis]|uniref:Flagellar protein FliS n=1 Tax=Breoghania corrubedonensis TaxID=665038 RepID=A0A2T5V6G1_9HYPH|nr:flagellar export chaperone FliS [Breoghania corrubedonensis]PTW59335.1 flagellar protein FliS [Breoghania corrubedonensis]